MSKDFLVPNISRIQPGQGVGANGSEQSKNKANPGEFADLLKTKVDPSSNDSNLAASNGREIKFSKHALPRAQERGLPLSNDLLNSLEKAVASADAKGSKSTLVLGDDAAFVVSVKNGTVVTVMDKANMQNNVFTNIDSTVLL